MALIALIQNPTPSLLSALAHRRHGDNEYLVCMYALRPDILNSSIPHFRHV